MKRLVLPLLALILIVSGLGRLGGTKKKKKRSKRVKKRMVAKVARKTTAAPVTTQILEVTARRIYKSGGINGQQAMRDPFASLLAKSSMLKQGEISLEGMRLVGVIGGSRGRKALLQDRDGKGYILRPGDKIGGGYVSSITDKEIIIEQEELGIKYQVSLKLEKMKEGKSHGKK